jgi:hypothetical protein
VKPRTSLGEDKAMSTQAETLHRSRIVKGARLIGARPGDRFE